MVFQKSLITPSLEGLSPIKYYVVSWRLGYTFHIIIIRLLAHRACWITKLHGQRTQHQGKLAIQLITSLTLCLRILNVGS